MNVRMADPIASQADSTTSTTVTIDATDSQARDIPTIHLKLRKPSSDRKVQWSTETVDNELMNRKKSKCCCIYKKPREFGESSSDESDDDCEHCAGHVEKKKVHVHDTAASECVKESTECTIESESLKIDPAPAEDTIDNPPGNENNL